MDTQAAMHGPEIINGFNQLLQEVEDFLDGTESVEGDEPLHELGPRINALCAAALSLSGEELREARVKMLEVKVKLQELSSIMDKAAEVSRHNEQLNLTPDLPVTVEEKPRKPTKKEAN